MHPSVGNRGHSYDNAFIKTIEALSGEGHRDCSHNASYEATESITINDRAVLCVDWKVSSQKLYSERYSRAPASDSRLRPSLPSCTVLLKSAAGAYLRKYGGEAIMGVNLVDAVTNISPDLFFEETVNFIGTHHFTRSSDKDCGDG